ncbi:MAG: hypothetical protein OK456_08855 [Thaumarchaeota archaeon]|nr:hypothetical protein [Nitrososphaerota archaeon]
MSDSTHLAKLEAILKEHEERIKSLEQRLEPRKPAEPKVAVQQPAPTPTPAPTPVAPPAPKVLTVRHFILEKGPTDDVQRALVIGYFLEKHGAYESFNAKDIEKGFVEGREKVPGNTSDKLLKNVWKGNMMQVKEDKDGLKAYVLTNAGTKFVETGFKQA